MSTSASLEDPELIENDNLKADTVENISSPSPYSPPNVSPNSSLTLYGSNNSLQTQREFDELREDTSKFDFEDDFINSSGMASRYFKPTEFTDVDEMEPQQIVTDVEDQPTAQLEHEILSDNATEDEGLDDTITSPHPARQIEDEIQNPSLEVLCQDLITSEKERTSTIKQRATPMLTDPAEDTRDTKMVRFI